MQQDQRGLARIGFPSSGRIAEKSSDGNRRRGIPERNDPSIDRRLVIDVFAFESKCGPRPDLPADGRREKDTIGLYPSRKLSDDSYKPLNR